MKTLHLVRPFENVDILPWKLNWASCLTAACGQQRDLLILKVGHRLIWNIQSSHELRQLNVLWKVQTHNIKLDTLHAQYFLIAERERSIFNTCRFDIGGFRGADWLRKCPHLSDTFAYRSAQNNLFLTLRVIHTLKKERKVKGPDYHRIISYEVVMK